MDYREPSGGWVGLDSGHPVQIQKITFSPRNRDNFIRKGDLYELFYAQTNGWESLGKQTATSDSLSYNAPEGALLYLRNHSRGMMNESLNGRWKTTIMVNYRPL